MRTVLQLAWAYARQNLSRTVLAALAMTASACVVVWIVSKFDSLAGGFDEAASSYMGRYQVLVSLASRSESIPDDLISRLKKDPSVTEVNELVLGMARVNPVKEQVPPPESVAAKQGKSSGRGRGRGPSGPTLIGTAATAPPHKLESGRWLDPSSTAREAVLTRDSAEKWGIGVGDEVKVTTRSFDGEEVEQVKLVGIIAQAPMLMSRTKGGAPGGPPIGPPAAALYVSPSLFEELNGLPGRTAFVNVALKEGVDPASFQADWSERLSSATPPINLYTFNDVKDKFEGGFAPQAARRQAFFVTGISLLASVFIIFTTLSMGVSERVRQFAILRAVGLTRGQVASLIVVEALGLAVLGWLGGLASGWLLLRLSAAANPAAAQSGEVSLGYWCVVLTGVSSVLGALLASIVPAWRAMRASPLDAMTPVPDQPSVQRVGTLALVGAALVALVPALILFPVLPNAARYWVIALVGGPALVVGFVLLAPAAILLAERLFAAPIAALFFVDRKMFATQLTGNLWRTVGVTVSLSIGLGLFVMTQLFGYSMLQQFLPAPWAPEYTVGITVGVPDRDIESVRLAAGVAAEDFLPLAVEQPKLAEDILSSKVRDSSTMQDNVVLVGVDPDRALGGASPFLKLRFVAGSASEAVAKMKEGRACIVPDHFAQGAKLGVGDSFELVPPPPPGPPGRSAPSGKPVRYTIAGIVALPGWHWMTKGTGMRLQSGRAGAIVLAPMQVVRRDFSIDRVNFFWMNGAGTDTAALESALMPIARQAVASAPPRRTMSQRMGSGPGGPPRGPVRVTAAASIRDSLTKRGGGMIWAMGELPLVTLVVASLGVLNTIVASVRARRWEMGVMRAVGVTRFGLMRLVLAEAVLVAAAACLLSLAFGLVAGWCSLALVEYSQYSWWGGGLIFSLTVPWGRVAIGLGAALAVCVAAAAWPAINAGRSEVLRLLQGGRASI